jgi:hypothetical protein
MFFNVELMLWGKWIIPQRESQGQKPGRPHLLLAGHYPVRTEGLHFLTFSFGVPSLSSAPKESIEYNVWEKTQKNPKKPLLSF